MRHREKTFEYYSLILFVEEITIAFCIGSFIAGALLGFITMASGSLIIKCLIDGIGVISLLFLVFLLMPLPTWGMSASEAGSSLSNYLLIVIPVIISYGIGDAFGSLGYALVTGKNG
jgi:hypothetical protein